MEIHYRALEHYLTKNASNMTPISQLRTQSGRKRQHNKSGSDYDSGESTLFMCLQRPKPSAVANVR